MIDCPSIININRLIDIDCHRLLSIAIDYRFHRLFRSCKNIAQTKIQQHIVVVNKINQSYLRNDQTLDQTLDQR